MVLLFTPPSPFALIWNESRMLCHNMDMDFGYVVDDGQFQFSHIFVKLREREGQRVDPGRSLKGHL